ncbi:dna topoisomerase iv subunit a [Lasius niger]|uniref:DNA topoisomerase 2 n=1 Tax=Lasius niger TaxID=67767 RepID=A0A0J7NMH3_LASNI|nr:dna topoisomerase iv subunit a [Lasius niger]
MMGGIPAVALAMIFTANKENRTGTGVLYFVVFYTLITKLNIQTPGRETIVNTNIVDLGDSIQERVKSSENKVKNSENKVNKLLVKEEKVKKDVQKGDKYQVLAENIIAAIGKENFVDVENCISRLRLTVKDTSKIDKEKIRAAGTYGILIVSKETLQIVIGTDVEAVADNKNNEIDIQRMKQVIAKIPSKEKIFHKAFDKVKNFEYALDVLAKLKMNAVLTAAGENNINQNLATLEKLTAMKKLTIIGGGGITFDNIKKISCVVNDVHVVTIEDDGRGIPTGKHKLGKSTPEVIFTTLHAGGKFDGSSYKTSGGLHGVGASVVNALNYNDTIIGFANNVKTSDGGSHLVGFKSGLTKAINEYARKQELLKAKDKNLEGNDLREGLVAIISLRVAENLIQYEGQTKSKLADIAEKIIAKAIKARDIRAALRKTKENLRNKTKEAQRILITKLTPPQKHNPKKNELFLVEGDSAGGSAKTARNRQFQAILSLKGKVINALKSNVESLFNNDEINMIIAAIGAGVGKEFNLENVNYNKVIIMTDADSDGAHIQLLLLTFFYRFMLDMQGNKGSIDGDSPAAMRYTELRLSSIAHLLLQDLKKDVVEFIPNFDASEKEPIVLPSYFPNLLVNGATGIAVGMATNIPPHNLHEVIDAVIYRISHPESTLSDIMKNGFKGPDFPTGGIIQGISGIKSAYNSGKGRIVIRSKTAIEVKEKARKEQRIVISEIPYEVLKQDLVKKIDDVRVLNKIHGIKEVRDETDRQGLRIVVDLTSDGNADEILNYLFKNTNLQVYYNLNLVAIANNKPQVLSLIKLLDFYITHQVEVITRKSKYDLKQLLQRLEIIEGLIIALNNIDKVVKLIRSSKNKLDAQTNLIVNFKLTAKQAEAIVSLRLYRLSASDVSALENEKEVIKKEIIKLEKILRDRNTLNQLLIEHFKKVKLLSVTKIPVTRANEGVATLSLDQTQEYQIDVSNDSTKFLKINPDLYGSVTFEELLKHGNFGLGTFHAVDGELIVLENKAYQVLANGEVKIVSKEMTSPFVTLTNFVSDLKLTFSDISFQGLKEKLVAKFPSLNIFYAIKITGIFAEISMRTLTKQKEPFISLKEVAKQQEELVLKNTTGDLVVFWAPSFANNILVQGFHAHFLTTDRKSGGHVFDFQAKDIRVDICYLTNMDLHLPQTESYLNHQLDSTSLQADIKKVESQRKSSS